MFIHIDKIPRLNSPRSLDMSSYDRWPSPLITFLALLWTCQYVHVSLVLGAQHWMQHSKCWAEENNHLPQPAGNALPEVAQETFCFKGPLLVHGQLLTSQLPHSIPRDWVCSSPGARLDVSWGSCWHVSSPVKIPLNGSTSVWCISLVSQFCIIC